MAKATRPTIAATNLLPAAIMLAPLPGVKVAGAVLEVFDTGDDVVPTGVPVALVLLEAGKGAGAIAIVMVAGAMDDGVVETTGVEVVVVEAAEDTLDALDTLDTLDTADELEELTAVEEATTGGALPLGPAQAMVSM